MTWTHLHERPVVMAEVIDRPAETPAAAGDPRDRF